MVPEFVFVPLIVSAKVPIEVTTLLLKLLLIVKAPVALLSPEPPRVRSKYVTPKAGVTSSGDSRVGIGKPNLAGGHIAHVIGGFSEDESPIIAECVERVVESVDCLLTEGIDRAMSSFN